MSLDVLSFLTLIGVTIIIGFVGSAVFRWTRIPDVLLLLAFGFLVGPAFGLVDPATFAAISPVLASVALLMILFDSGLSLRVYSLIRNAPRSMLLACLGFVVQMGVVAVLAAAFLSFDTLSGLLLGVILAGTSAEVVISLVDKIRLRENIRQLLILESVITDPLTIIASITILQLMTATAAVSPLQSILGAFSIGSMVGLAGGMVWLFALDWLKGRPYSHMLTIAVAFLLYVFVELAGGSGALSALLFGLVLSNGREFSAMLKLRKTLAVGGEMRAFQDEVTFFIRSFFFVFLGIIVVIQPSFVVAGVVIAAALILSRIPVAKVTLAGLGAAPVEKKAVMTMGPRGLAAAVVAQLPAAYGLPHAATFSNLTFVIIIVTVVTSAAAAGLLSRSADRSATASRKSAKARFAKQRPPLPRQRPRQA